MEIKYPDVHAWSLLYMLFLCFFSGEGINKVSIFFYVLLTVYLSMFILVINQLDAQNFVLQ